MCLQKKRMIMKQIKQIIVVEGRDDERAVRSAVNAQVIRTSGYGICKETWDRIDRAIRGPGIIIFTDPDNAGELIRNRIKKRYPLALHAYLTCNEAKRGEDIGIENASPQSIRQALGKARCEEKDKKDTFTVRDLAYFGLEGSSGSRERRARLGFSLGIGYGNAKTFLQRLNSYGITREEFYMHGEAIFAENPSKDKE